MAAIYADENVPLPVVGFLRSAGHDVVTAFEAGRANQGISDADQLQYAAAAGRTILTNNGWDFNRLHAANPNHAGIVTFSDDDDERSLAGRIGTAVNAAGHLTGRLIKVTRPTRP